MLGYLQGIAQHLLCSLCTSTLAKGLIPSLVATAWLLVWRIILFPVLCLEACIAAALVLARAALICLASPFKKLASILASVLGMSQRVAGLVRSSIQVALKLLQLLVLLHRCFSASLLMIMGQRIDDSPEEIMNAMGSSTSTTGTQYVVQDAISLLAAGVTDARVRSRPQRPCLGKPHQILGLFTAPPWHHCDSVLCNISVSASLLILTHAVIQIAGPTQQPSLPGDVLSEVASHWQDHDALARQRLVCHQLRRQLAAKVKVLLVRDDGSMLQQARRAFSSATDIRVCTAASQMTSHRVTGGAERMHRVVQQAAQVFPTVAGLHIDHVVLTAVAVPADDADDADEMVPTFLPDRSGLPQVQRLHMTSVCTPADLRLGPWRPSPADLAGLTELTVSMCGADLVTTAIDVGGFAGATGLTALHLSTGTLAHPDAISGAANLECFTYTVPDTVWLVRLLWQHWLARPAVWLSEERALLQGLAGLARLRRLVLPVVDIDGQRWALLAQMPALQHLEVRDVDVGQAECSPCAAVTSVVCRGLSSSTVARLAQLLPGLREFSVRDGSSSMVCAVLSLVWQRAGNNLPAGVSGHDRAAALAAGAWRKSLHLAQQLDASSLGLLWQCKLMWLAGRCLVTE